MPADRKGTTWFAVYNASEDTIPAFGLMRITGVNEANFITVEAPRGGGAIADILVNGPGAIGPEAFGQGHRNFPCSVSWEAEQGSGEPEPGQVWGLEDESWSLKPRAAGFLILSPPARDSVVATPFHGEALIRFRLTESLTGAGPANAVPLVWNPDDSDWTLEGAAISIYASVLDGGMGEDQKGWAAWKADSNRWEVVAASPSDGSFWAKITERGLLVDGCNIYGFTEQLKKPRCPWEDGPRTGTVGAWVEAKLVSPVGGLAAGETWGVMVHGATSGQFKLTVDGTETAWIDFDASDSDISDALVAAGANLVAASFTFDDTDPHSITWTHSTLKPDASNYAVDVNDRKIDPLNTRERLWPGYVATPTVTIEKTQAGDGMVASIFDVDLTDVGGGTYALTFTLGGVEFTTDPIDWDADSSAIETAITDATGSTCTVSGWTQSVPLGTISYTITFVSSLLDYDATADGSLLLGNGNYTLRWPGGGGTDAFPPPDVPTTCVQFLQDYSLDTETCVETKTFAYFKIPANWLDPATRMPYTTSGDCAAGST